ncbi:uncharacterized protein LODBEIA_P07270 [Lodderomyces beijingensis]|uniref:Ferric oxidoreductase domain-containing protein n=1 Tax=Lodderomyces beijingensis TaxID=1775926 RepID=A0ABP0ZEC4_9ASCO
MAFEMGGLNSTSEVWHCYFHFPKGKSKEYSQLRNYTTAKYGAITTALLVLIILSIPAYQYFVIHHYRLKFHYLRRFYSTLNHYISHEHHPNCRTATWTDRLVTRVATMTKALAFYILLHFQTIAQLVFWTCFLSLLSLVDIYHGDLIFLAKRLGRIAANCLPTVLFLTLRPSPLPNILYLTLIPIHKWLSRLIILQSVIHTIIYLAFFNYNHTWEKAWKTENLYGWMALAGFLIIIVTSLSTFRRRWYKVFYFMHYAWTWIIVACLQVHVRPEPYSLYTTANVSILLGQVIYRVHLTTVSTRGEVKVIDVSPNLSLVEFPSSLIAKPATAPGAHIRLTNYSSTWIVRAFKQIIPNYHPYTLVSLPQDRLQRLVIRKSNFKLDDGHRYLITGSYDPHLLFVHFKRGNKKLANPKWSLSKLHIDAKRLLIVVGGSAISFALPILRVMNYHGIPTKVVWVIKDFRDILILKYFEGVIHGDDFEIFVTGSDRIEEKDNVRLKHQYSSHASGFGKRSIGALSAHYDLENEETTPLLGTNAQLSTLNQENQFEDVDVGINSDEEDDSGDCTHYDASPGCRDTSAIYDDIDDVLDENVSDYLEHDVNEDEFEVTNDSVAHGSSARHISSPSTNNHGNISRKPSTNEPFVPIFFRNSPAQDMDLLSQFQSVTRKLNLQKRIYKGRPKLNHRYYNWCINEGFTQCSGPVEDENHNLVCCQDLPRNKVVEADLNAEKIWVIGAGPKQLVENVKLWSSENGLKFHEEAFYS